MAWISWGKLVDLTGDTGTEIQITARVLIRQVLYREVDSYYTPLAYYANALGLLVFGQRLEVFYSMGLVLGLIITLLVYWLAVRLTDGRWATLCSLYIVIYCCFSPWSLPGGMYTLTVPYSYGAVYATVFSLLAFTAIDQYGQTFSLKWLIVAASACGFAGLAKQEYGVAALCGVLVGSFLCSPKNLQAIVRRSFLVILVASICVFTPLIWFSQQASWEEVSTSLFPTILQFQVFIKSGLFNFSLAKTLNVWQDTFKSFAITTSLIFVAMVAASWLSRQKWFPTQQWLKSLIELLSSIAFTWFGWFILRRLPWFSDMVFRPLDHMTWLLPVLVVWFAFKWRLLIKHRHAPLLWTLVIFTVLLNARFWFYIHYYKIYGVTAIVLFFTLLYHLTRRSRLPFVRFVVICLLISASINLKEFTRPFYPVVSSQGTVYTRDANLALAFNQIIQTINVSNGKSGAVIPVGSLLNFLTATHSPSEKIVYSPGVLPTPSAEQEFVEKMQQNSPDFIVYVDFPFTFLNKGYQSYAEYNPLVHQWIVNQHRLVYSSPKLHFDNQKWTIRLYFRDS
jgi:4-amino-4-deoxy-L-arabinose transferase-like glycosyltransferase